MSCWLVPFQSSDWASSKVFLCRASSLSSLRMICSAVLVSRSVSMETTWSATLSRNACISVALRFAVPLVSTLETSAERPCSEGFSNASPPE